MANTDTPPGRSKTGPQATGLGTTQSLQFKLGMFFLLAVLLLTIGAYVASRKLVQGNLLDENFRYEQEAGLRLTADLRAVLGDAQSLATLLANLAADPELQIDALRNAGPLLVKSRSSTPLISSLGIWIEPGTIAGLPERSSFFWVANAEGVMQARGDYNDARSAPYFRERWYTPARYLARQPGFWTGRRQEPLLDREVLTFVAPILRGGRFSGAVTVSLDAEALNKDFMQQVSGTQVYALLLDGSQRLIGISGQAVQALNGKAKLGATLAELAKAESAYKPLALALFQRAENRRTAVSRSPQYDAAQVAELRDATRELSRQEAEQILSDLALSALPAAPETMAAREPISIDAVLGKDAWASLFELQDPAWTVIRVTPADQGFGGVSVLFRQSLLASAGLVVFTLLLAFLALRGLVIQPLQQMVRQLAGSHDAEDALHIVLDASARNELGMLAHWQNERIRQLREATDHVRATQTQLASELSGKRQLQEQFQLVRERTALAMQSVSDAVVITDADGRIEDMNGVAEALVGISLREAKGQPLQQVVRFRSEDSSQHQNLALLAMERDSALDYSSGIILDTALNGARTVVLNGSPLRSQRRMVGAVLVFHERAHQRGGSDAAEARSAAVRHQRDTLTGLATRNRCEQRITALIEQARPSGSQHAVVFLDIDHLKRINDSGGQSAGDDVLVRVAETLTQAAPSAQDVFRSAADQFVVVLESVNPPEALAIAEQLRTLLASTRFYWESRYFAITASFGVAPLDRNMPSAIEAIRRADDACAAAKRSGRNCVQPYDSRMDRVGRNIDDASWVRCIRRGLSDNLFHLRTQWIMPGKEYAHEGPAYEVLLALEDDEGFWAAPAAFMPIADRHHITPAIDRWVLEHTLRYLQKNQGIVDGMAFCSVNLSTQSLAEPAFLDFVADCFERYPALAPKICFELREPSLTDHPREAALFCEVLDRMGCLISIDHYFGRHLSDLTLLRKLPIDFIKLDAQGFKQLGTDKVEQMLAESILKIVRHLRRRVIVNNIDDPSTMEIWKSLGADYFQGYAFAKPTPVPFLPPA